MRLDLHTHPFEALRFPNPPIETYVGRIADAIRRKGIDGIAITEHGHVPRALWYGLHASDRASRYYSDISIIAGVENDAGNGVHIIDLFVPDEKNRMRIYRILAHPSRSPERYVKWLPHIDFIEVENLQHKAGKVDEALLKKALDMGVQPIRVSDAHSLDRIGDLWTEVEFPSPKIIVDLGCGWKKDSRHIGLDKKRTPVVDIICDLTKGIPFKENSVDIFCSSHLLEHLPHDGLLKLLNEIIRVGKKGCKVKLIVPAWNYEFAMNPGHRHTIPPEWFRELEVHRDIYFPSGTYLKLIDITYHYRPEGLKICKKLGLTPEEGAKYLNNIIYEIEYTLKVVK